MDGTTLVYIEWIDSQSHDGWVDPDEHEIEFQCVKTIGFLVKESSMGIAIATSFDSTNDMNLCVVDIPKICIMKQVIFNLSDLGFVDEQKD